MNELYIGVKKLSANKNTFHFIYNANFGCLFIMNNKYVKYDV